MHFFYVDIGLAVPQLSSTTQLHVLFPSLQVNHLMGSDQVLTWLHKGYQPGYGNVQLACET
jgi:hypothetical protein